MLAARRNILPIILMGTLLTSLLVAINSNVLNSLGKGRSEHYLIVGVYGGKYVNESSLHFIMRELEDTSIRIGNVTWRIKAYLITESDIKIKYDIGMLYDIIILPDGDMSSYVSALSALRDEVSRTLQLGGGFIGIGSGAYVVTRDIVYPGTKELKYTGWGIVDVRTYVVTYSGNVTLRLTNYGLSIFNKTTSIFNKTCGYVFDIFSHGLPLAIIESAMNASGNISLVIGYPISIAYEGDQFRSILIGYTDLSPRELMYSIAYVAYLLNPSPRGIIAKINILTQLMYNVTFPLTSSSVKKAKAYLSEAIDCVYEDPYKALTLYYSAKSILRKDYLHWLSYQERKYIFKSILFLSLLIVTIMSSLLFVYIQYMKRKHFKLRRKGKKI